jgi:hypothetical protein
MKSSTFVNMILEPRLEKIRAGLASKSKEYSSDNDRLHNFKIAARVQKTTPEKALWGMAMRDLVSVIDIIEKRRYHDTETIGKKIGGLINHLILLEAITAEPRLAEIEAKQDALEAEIEKKKEELVHKAKKGKRR